MYFNKDRLFGPQVPQISSFSSTVPYQRGYGLFGGLFSNIARRLVPLASKASGLAKKVLGSKLIKNTGSKLLDAAVEGTGEVVADLISGKNDPKETMKKKLSEAREEISQTIREATKRKNESLSSVKPKKRKKVRLVARKALKPVKRRKYNLLEDEDEFSN